ncbi:MAG: hypothetical protein RR702_06855, partial [Clostridia bacterium]
RNTSNTYTTGGGNYIGNVLQSTTGNVTGVYDMSDCAWATMAAYIGGYTTAYNGNLITNKDTKYVDVYAKGSNPGDRNSCYQANADKYGDAQYEVSINGENSPVGWSGDFTKYPSSTFPVYYRGGGNNYGMDGAGVFAVADDTGKPIYHNGWVRSLHFVTSFPSVYSQLCKFVLV